MEKQEIFNKRNMYEIGSLFAYVILTLILHGLNKSLFVAILSAIFILGLIVYLCFQYKHFSVINKQGKKSILFFIILLYSKLNVLGYFMIAYSYPPSAEDFAQKIIRIIFPAVLLVVCTIVLCRKHSWKELMNILVYFIPLLLCLF